MGNWRIGFSILGILLLAVIVWPLVRWAFIDAYWVGVGPEACPDKTGACWPFIRERFDQLMYGVYPIPERWRVNTGLFIGFCLMVPILVPKIRAKALWVGLFVSVYPILAVILFSGGVFGLEKIQTSLWGGLFLSLVVGVFAFAFALPTGILLALGRESKIPAIRILAGTWVEIWRSVPTLVVLFVAVIMLPLFLPPQYEVDKLLRALVALSILMSCHMAEAIRGALRAIPAGQYEAATALGIGYWKTQTHIILPQALAMATPQITNVVIGLFKETSLLVVIGLFDFLGIVQAVSGDSRWHLSSARATGYLFVAFVYWCICFSMSRYSSYLERSGVAMHRR
ncbi:amino acid ABC transporter permease [Govanella unica]|uniref:Amino acid ABC transporter permease n=1 Tax=Govanella unica TaxID=2975056 RepID=A0A9X3TY07_9PROT|nr:amino acid ABC transporter permease [Govania unica]MDA5193871.1 amino acid ABC transporter permease [Govania unica]